MKRIILISVIIIFSKVIANAQLLEYDSTDIKAVEALALKAFDKCLKNKKVLPKEKFDIALYENVKLRPIPICKAKSRDKWVVDTTKTPYLTLIYKDNQYIGVVSCDDCGNCYIDKNYFYKLFGVSTNMKHLSNIVLHADKQVFNLVGTDDMDLYAFEQTEITHLNVLDDYIENEDVYTNEKFEYSRIVFKPLKEETDFCSQVRIKNKNSRRHLKKCPTEDVKWE